MEVMKQEDKDLLLKYLCMALPYGVICQVDDGAAGFNDGKLVEIDVSEELARFDVDYCWNAYIDNVKPYLRPMSSMTSEERKWLQSLPFPYDFIDALNKHHFDYRGLIEKGLALEAPEEMY